MTRLIPGAQQQKWSPVMVSLIISVSALILTLSLTFINSQHHLHHAVTEHSKAYKFHSDQESDWQNVYSIALRCKGREEFIQTLKLEGYLVSTSTSNPVPIEELEFDEAFAQDVADPNRKDLAVILPSPSPPSPVKGTELRGNLSGSGVIGGGGGDRAQKDDYGEIANVYEQGPRDVIPEEDTSMTGKKEKDERSGGSPTTQGLGGRGEDGAVFKVPPGTDGGPPQMSAALARHYAVNNTVIVTWANYALWDFVKSWTVHVKKLGITNIMVGAMDLEIGRALVASGINSFAMYESSSNHSGVGSNHLQWGGESFHKMGRQKISLAKLFLGCNLNLLLVDVDVVILRNVMQYFGRYPEADILVSSDHLRSTLQPGDEGLEKPAEAGSPMNIGIMYFRYSQRTVHFVDSWLDTINAKPDYWDQNAFNDMARAAWDPVGKVHPENPRVFKGYNDSLHIGVLPVAMFSGGHTYYVQRLYEVQNVQPYAVHCTFQYGANAGKRNRMREAMIFEDEEEYYTSDSYVLVDLKRVPNMGVKDFAALNYTQKKQYNVKGLHMQMESYLPGIGVSLLFNRSLIMPKLACYCDRFWTPLDNCRVPGADQERLPFMCPMDYVLDPIFMTDEASKMVVRWREHSFLENPRCPETVKGSKLTIYTSSKYKSVSERYIVQEGGTTLLLPSGLNSTQLSAALLPYSHYKVWHFHDVAAAFKGFDDPVQQLEYQRRIDHLVPITQPDDA